MPHGQKTWIFTLRVQTSPRLNTTEEVLAASLEVLISFLGRPIGVFLYETLQRLTTL